MSELTQEQRDVSNSVVGASLAFLGVVMVAAMPLAANAQRMTGIGLPPKEPTVAPTPPPQPTTPPSYTQPPAQPQRPAQPAPPVAQPPRPTSPNPQYAPWRPYGPMAEGRVHVRPDESFRWTQVFGFTAAVQDNGQQGNDQIWVDGPEGEEHIWANCNVTQTWRAYGPNSEGFVDAVVTQWCGW